MNLHRSPLEMFGLTLEQFKLQSEQLRHQQWQEFMKSVDDQEFGRLYQAYNQSVADNFTIKYNGGK